MKCPFCIDPYIISTTNIITFAGFGIALFVLSVNVRHKYILDKSNMDKRTERNCMDYVNFANKSSTWGIFYILSALLVLIGAFLNNPFWVLGFSFSILFIASFLLVVSAIYFNSIEKIKDFIRSVLK